MFRPRKAHESGEDLLDRVAHLEGLCSTLLSYMSNRGNMIRSLHEKTQAGTVERGLVDLMLTLEREAFAKVFATELAADQQPGLDNFISVMSRALRSQTTVQ